MDDQVDIVHPEVRAHINSLVSALGGANPDDDGPSYQLGDDALEVLRDLKRWIRFYDEKTNRMDVARCLHQANLIEGDLLPILSLWPEDTTESKFRSKIILACFEIMVPLTWPMERDKERMTVNHHRHMPVLELAQVAYKRAIINLDCVRILHSAVRTTLPSLALPIGDRSARDQGIIKLILFFLRNIAMIDLPPDVRYDGDEKQISRSTTIDTFSFQDIFLFLLTIASNMGSQYNTEDIIVMEIIFHLVKRVDVEQLFMSDQQVNKAKASELTAMMRKETAMLNTYNRKAPTRHSRFGTMIWVKRDGSKMTSLSGQDALADASTRFERMDRNKTFKPPRRARKDDKDRRFLGPQPKLDSRAKTQLASFVGDFLDSSFNPLFSHVRKTIDREAPHLMQYHKRQFFYLVAWFLQAERQRAKVKKSDSEVTSFNLVAVALTQEMFITLYRTLRESFEMKEWADLTAVMRCLTQILLTVQDMLECAREEDQVIAENVLSRLFYEDATHDLLVDILKAYKGLGFDYLDAITELVHHYLRILEAYSKQNVDMRVRALRRGKGRAKKNTTKTNSGEGQEPQNLPEYDDSEHEDYHVSEKTAKERKFDFHRFASKFEPQGAVDAFVAFAKYYRDLNDTQLKRAHRFFYRIAFKQNMSVMLLRVDIIHLFHKMVKGPEGLESSSSTYKDWEELVKQIMRKCIKKMEQHPGFIVEMLFSKTSYTAHYFEFGEEKQTLASKAAAKPAVELVFKHETERDQQIAIVIGAMLDKNQSDHISWLKELLTNAESERRAWATAEEARLLTEPDVAQDLEQPAQTGSREPPLIVAHADSDDRKKAILKNPHLRLLMAIAGLRLMGPASEETLGSSWTIPGDLPLEHLKDTLHFISQAEFSPPTFEEGVLADHQLKRKTAPKRKAAFDDDEEVGEDEYDFEMGGPTNRSFIDDADRPKKKGKSRKRRKSIDDEELAERARQRKEREREKARKIKSALYVREGDDEFDSDEDEAFFAREREIAARAAKAADQATASLTATSTNKKRKSYESLDSPSDNDDEVAADDNDSIDGESSNEVPRLLSSPGDNLDEDETDDTSLHTSGEEGRKRRKARDSRIVVDDNEDTHADSDASVDLGEPVKMPTGPEEDEEGGDEGPALAVRRRIRSGFVVESDDDD